MSIRPLLAGLAVLPLLASCVMQGDVDALSRRMAQNEQRMQQLTSQVGNVEQVLPGQAEMWAQMQSMRQELNTVRGQLDEMNSGGGVEARGQAGQLAARVARLEMAVRQIASELGISVEALDTPLEGSTPPAAAGAAAPGTQAPGAAASAPTAGAASAPNAVAPSMATPASKPTDTATNLYDSGMNAFAARNYSGAIKAFTDFTTTFPNHNLVSNAHFWRGESYYQMKNYPSAALAYQDLIQKYPGGAKFQSAMLKQGMALYAAGKTDAGKARLNELVKKYPTSPEAGRAKRFLQQNK